MLILFLYSALAGLMTLWIHARIFFGSQFNNTLIFRVISGVDLPTSLVWLLFTSCATLGAYLGLYGVKSRFRWLAIAVSPRDKLRRSQKLMDFIPWVNYVLNSICFLSINGPTIASFEKYFRLGRYGFNTKYSQPATTIVEVISELPNIEL